MMLALRIVLLTVLVLYLCIVAYMYLQQRQIQYHPSRTAPSPQSVGLSGVNDERITTPDGETIAVWYAAASPGKPTILFLHGNAGEIGTRGERFSFYRSQGFGVLFVSYRGYGASTGNITEAGLITDALSAYEFLIGKGVAPQQIAVVGESLGTGVAVQLAAQRKVGAMALEAPYTATVDVGAEIYPWLPVRLLMKDTFKSRDFIGRVTAPLLVQHGDADTIIPVAHGRALFAMANEPKQLVIIPGLGHDAIAAPETWVREVRFFTQHIPVQ